MFVRASHCDAGTGRFKQKQVMDSFVRVRAFLRHMELRQQADQAALLLDEYIRPIVTIARA